MDGFELALLGCFALASCWVIGLDLYYQASRGLLWTGTDGGYISDQLQYLAWIRSASQHFLISDLYVVRHTPADYFQPAIVLCAGLTRLGVAPWLALLMWKPVALVACFAATRAYAQRSLSTRWQRRTALALGLFFVSVTWVYGAWNVVGDLSPVALSWGYPFSLLALAAMVYALLRYERARSAGRIVVAPALLAALAGIMHPWNDETFIVILAACEVLALRGGRPAARRVALAAVTLAGAAAPLLYYMLLGKLDPTWSMARQASRHEFAFWPLVLAVAPLLPLAAIGFAGRRRGFWWTAVRLWPVATLAIFFFSQTSAFATPLHAWQGITLPLGVLAAAGAGEVRGRLARVRRPRVRRAALRVAGTAGAAALLATCGAAMGYQFDQEPSYMSPRGGNGNFIAPSEGRALSYLASDRTPGGVLTRSYLGELVPARTGRSSYEGDCMWSQPGCAQRHQLTERLFFGHLGPAAARRFVQSTGARFVLEDCESRAELGRLLAPLIASEQRVGCAAVYELRTG
jgi:hypothetical protein